MKEPLLYIVESIVCGGLFLAVWRLFVMRFTDFRVSRIFLQVAIWAACLIPLLQIPVWSADELVIVLPMLSDAGGEDALPLVREVGSSGWRYVWMGIYLTGAVLLALRMILSNAKVWRLRFGSRLTAREDCIVAVHPAVKSPCSLFSTVYLPEGLEKEEYAQILTHEESHVRHGHSYERLLMEVLRMVCWFNPFVWLAFHWLVEIQETEADSDVLQSGFDVTEYRVTLLKQVLGVQGDWACALVNHPLKRRFLAMTAERKHQNFRMWMSCLYCLWRWCASDSLPALYGYMTDILLLSV